MALFKRFDETAYTNSITQYLPTGQVLASKNIPNTNLRRFIEALAQKLKDKADTILDYCSNFMLITAENEAVLEIWEEVLGLPTACSPVLAPTLEGRKADILAAIQSFGAFTQADFEALATVLGVNIQWRDGLQATSFPLLFRGVYFSNQDAYFAAVIDIPAGQSAILVDKLKCLFDTLKSATDAFAYIEY